MKVRPLHDRLIIKTSEEEEKTKGGIIIPDTAKEKPVEGKVIAIGAGRIKKDGTKMPLEIKKATGSSMQNMEEPRSKSTGKNIS